MKISAMKYSHRLIPTTIIPMTTTLMAKPLAAYQHMAPADAR